MRHFAFRITATLTTGLVLIFVWSNVWNGCRVGPGRTARKFVAIAMWCAIGFTRGCYWCSMQNGAVYNFTSCTILLSEYAATTWIMALHWSSLVECMQRVPGRTVCTFVTIAAWCAIDLVTRSCYWCSMQYGSVYYFILCAILLSEYATTLILALHWSSLVEYMERVPCWPGTNSA